MQKALLSFFLFASLFSSSSLLAQSFCADSVKAQFIRDWERAKIYTLDYLNTMPADKYSFKAVDSIRSFAQQMLHLAAANYGLMTLATGIQPTGGPGRGVENRPGAQSKDSVVYYVTSSYDFAIDCVKKLDASRYGEHAGQGNFGGSRYALLEKAFEHQTHHRAQTTIYIRLEGIKPPNERLF